MYYKGTVVLTEGVKAVLSGSKDAKTTEYGDSFVTFTFETGSEKYKVSWYLEVIARRLLILGRTWRTGRMLPRGILLRVRRGSRGWWWSIRLVRL
jgi:hypothetical protein